MVGVAPALGERIGLARFAVAVVTVVAAVAAAALLGDHAPQARPFLLLVATAVSAWFGGLEPALLAAGLSVAALLLPPVVRHGAAGVGFTEVIGSVSCVLVALAAGSLHAARRRAEQAIRERDARLALVSEQLPAGLWSTDTELNVTSGFGSGLANLEGPNLLEHLTAPDPELRAVEAHRRALQGVPSTYELQWQDRTYQSHVEPLRNAGGSIIGVVGVALDITDRKQAEQSLKEAKELAETASRAKDRFLAMLSHELRTPLTPALVAASALDAKGDLDPNLREAVEVIRRNIELEAMLIDDLLDLTRVAKGKLELRREVVDAHRLLRSALEVCHHDLASKRIEVSVDLRADHHWVHGDAPRLRQVFWNLLKNAGKFTPPGGRIAVRSFLTPDGQLCVEVSDTGIGIEPEHLPHIFNAFEQGSSMVTRQFGGLGLGLSISKAIMDAHGGQLAAESGGAGQGATFRLCLGVVPAPADAPGADRSSPAQQDRLERVAPSAPPAGAAPATPTGPLRILLVEDHVDTLRTLARLLRDAGHAVTTAASMGAALEAAAAEEFDLVVSDVGLPDGSGLDLMRQLRQHRPVRGIALTGYGMESDVAGSLEAGFVRHLTKPVEYSELEEAIEQVARG